MTAGRPFNPVAYKEGQRADWGAAAEGWRRWYPMLEAEEAGQRVSASLVGLARIGPGASVLDVGGGYGEPSLTAAAAVGPEGRVVCTDLSAEMLAFGRARAEEAGLSNIEFLERDAEQLAFEPESFDAVVSRWVLMLLPDPAGTLRTLRALLKPGGRLAAAVWGPPSEVEFTAARRVVLEELSVPPPPPGSPGIHALGDRDRLADLVASAGFHDVEIDSVTSVFQAESPEQFTQFQREVAVALARLVAEQPPDVQERVWAKVTQTWHRFLDDEGRVRTENEALLVTGVR
jgi:ubiquinone/menaquinone biosynthesis C-methylase UbiE